MMQSFFPEANLIGPWLGRLAGVPVILGSRRNMNHASPDQPRHIHRPMQWGSNLLVDQVIANSTAVLERVIQSERLPRHKICVVYNGIDADQVRPMHGMRAAMRARLRVGDDELLVGNISGLRKIKGVECFVQAAALARRAHPKLRFVLVGEGSMREDLTRMVAENNLQNILVLAGPAEDVRPYLAAMDIAVLCSLAEGFSNSLLEYMLAGLPIVATDVGGNREALGGAGILIKAGDAQQLATAVGSLIDVDARDHYAAAALRAVRRFDLKIAESRVGDLFWSHLEKKSLGKWSRPRPSVQKISPVAREREVVTLRSDLLESRALASAGDVHRA
jgi:glycosyltransferase involved in cell wall biosynthesis